MLIDKTHRSPILLTLFAFIISMICYLFYINSVPDGPTGGSWQGVSFGIAGTVCMIFAGLLSGRKKLPGRRLLSVKWWLRWHLWIGLLSVPLILFHSGFRFGGPLEIVLMIVFFAVILSGIYGLVLQQSLPKYLSTSVPAQAIQEQISVACERLRQSVDATVTKTCQAYLTEPAKPVAASSSFKQLQTMTMTPVYSPDADLWNFFQTEVSPFLSYDATPKHPLAKSSYALTRISKYQGSLPKRFAPALQEIQDACDERRQLFRQVQIHQWLHGWLIWHIPLSMILLVLSVLHITMALYY